MERVVSKPLQLVCFYNRKVGEVLGATCESEIKLYKCGIKGKESINDHCNVMRIV